MERLTLLCALFFALAACAPPEAQTPTPIDLSAYNVVDLSYPYNDKTVYWPTEKSGFVKTTLSEGMSEDGFYAAFAISTPEHGGTHMDAPYHFDINGDTAEAVPLPRLMAPAVVIDVSDKAAADRNYRLAPEDVAAFEAAHGEIAPGAIVLMRTDWSRYWPDAEAYLGGDDPAALSFPSFGAEAVRVLVEERRVGALGLDTASTDYGLSRSFPVHRIMGAANTPGFENLTNLDKLPPTGAFVIALPMKIEGGSGAPLRAVALTPKD